METIGYTAIACSIVLIAYYGPKFARRLFHQITRGMRK